MGRLPGNNSLLLLILEFLQFLSLFVQNPDPEVGRYPDAAVDKGTDCGRHLDGRHLERLAKTHGGKFHLAHIFRLMHDSACLSGQIHPGRPHQSKLLEIFIEILCSQPKTDLNEHRIAGILYPLHESFRPVAAHLVATDLPVLYDPVARTDKGILKIHHPLLQTGGSRNDLKGGSRLIGIVDAAVAPHLV